MKKALAALIALALPQPHWRKAHPAFTSKPMPHTPKPQAL